MRADRLIAIVLLLQAHGTLSAGAIARRLETSERTVRRDLDALLLAGVPLYSRRGRGGGWQLLGGHRIDLSGLTAPEAEALFLATSSGSAGLGAGVDAPLAAARRKVLAALPAPLRQAIEDADAVVLVDPARWGPAGALPASAEQPADIGAHLATLRRAVVEGVQVVLRYERPGMAAEDRTVHPYGLVAKRGVWYLVGATERGVRSYRLSRMREVRVTATAAERPDDLDLAEVWAGVQVDLARRMAPDLAVQLLASAPGARRVEATVGAWWPVEREPPGPTGRVRLTARFPNAAAAANELLGVAADEVEVLGPPPVLRLLADAGRRLVARYDEEAGAAADGDPAPFLGGA